MHEIPPQPDSFRLGKGVSFVEGGYIAKTPFEQVKAFWRNRKRDPRKATPDNPVLMAALVEFGRRELNARALRRFKSEEVRHLANLPLRTGSTSESLYGDAVAFAKSRGWQPKTLGSSIQFTRAGSLVRFDLASAYARTHDSWIELPDIVLRKDGVHFVPLAGLDLLR